MLARHIEHLLGAAILEHLFQRVEFPRFGQVREIAGMQEEFRRFRQGVDARDGFAKRGGDVHVGGFVESDMAVADLHKMQLAGRQCGHGAARDLAERTGGKDAAAQRPEHAGAGPGHAFEKTAAVDTVGVMIMGDEIVHGRVGSWKSYATAWKIFPDSLFSRPEGIKSKPTRITL